MGFPACEGASPEIGESGLLREPVPTWAIPAPTPPWAHRSLITSERGSGQSHSVLGVATKGTSIRSVGG